MIWGFYDTFFLKNYPVYWFWAGVGLFVGFNIFLFRDWESIK